MSRRNLSLLILLLLLVFVEVWTMAPQTTGSEAEQGASPKASEASREKDAKSQLMGESGQVMHEGYLIESKGDQKEWELWAKRSTRMGASSDWNIEQVKVQFYGKDGAGYTVTGDSGRVNTENKNMEIKGNVVTRTTNGYVFESDSALYESQTRKLRSNSHVKVTGPKEADGSSIFIEGDEMLADLQENVVDILKNVRAKKLVRDNRTALINSRKAKFIGNDKAAYFRENVVIDIDSMRISGNEAKFEYGTESKNIENVLVQGNVTVTDVDKVATSRQLQISLKEDKYVFKGAPKVVQNGDELNGEEITFFEGGKKVRVSNARARLDSNTLDSKKSGGSNAP